MFGRHWEAGEKVMQPISGGAGPACVWGAERCSRKAMKNEWQKSQEGSCGSREEAGLTR